MNMLLRDRMSHMQKRLSVYASALKRRERLTGTTLREFDGALEWARIGSVEPGDPGVRANAWPVRAPAGY